MQFEFQYNDGGRSQAGFKGSAGDCVCRSIAIATGLPYLEVYDALNTESKNFNEKKSARYRGKSSSRSGVHKPVYHKYLLSQGFKWVPTMTVGSGCKVHLLKSELPHGILVVRVSKHMCAVINGVIHDTYNPSRDGERCVYGYYIK